MIYATIALKLKSFNDMFTVNIVVHKGRAIRWSKWLRICSRPISFPYMNRTFKVWASVSSTPPSPWELDFQSSEALTHFACAPSLPILVREDEETFPLGKSRTGKYIFFFCKKRKSQKERGGGREEEEDNNNNNNKHGALDTWEVNS